MRKATATRPTVTRDDLFTMRDALIHADRAHANDLDPTLRQRYADLFRKLGVILNSHDRA